MMTRREYAVARILARRWSVVDLCRMQDFAIRDLRRGEGDWAGLVTAIARYDVAIAIRAIDGAPD